MQGIPVMKCPTCGTLMKYRGGPSDSNIFFMICPATGCRHQETCYAEQTSSQKGDGDEVKIDES